jgi:hypothetical protein
MCDRIEREGKAVPGIFRLGVQTISLQGRAFSGKFLAFDREQVGELPANVEGALAYTLFKDKVLQIDYPHVAVRVLDPHETGTAAGGSEGKNPVHQPDGLFDATVGNALFARSVVTLDFHAMKINVQPG